MKHSVETYVDLIERFLGRKLSAEQFSNAFVHLYKAEDALLEEPLFLLLDELFGDAESYTANPALLADHPDLYLNDARLESAARDILRRLKMWYGQQVAA